VVTALESESSAVYYLRFFLTRFFLTRVFLTRVFLTRVFLTRVFLTRVFLTRVFLTRVFLIYGRIEMASLRRSVGILGLLMICSGMALQQGGPGGPGGSSAPVWDFINPTNNQVYDITAPVDSHGTAIPFPAPPSGTPDNYTVQVEKGGIAGTQNHTRFAKSTGLSTDDGFIGTWSTSVSRGAGLNFKADTYWLRLYSGVPGTENNWESEVQIILN